MNRPTIQTIFASAFEAFHAAHRLPPFLRLAAWCLQHCHTAKMGLHARRCPNGHITQIHYNACKHRSCPACGWADTQRWLQAEQQRLLNAPHFHAIFTIPAWLHPLWRFNRRRFGHRLFHAAWQSLAELLHDPKYLGATPGVVLVLHTWTQTLKLHPHIHAVVTAGGVTATGKWKSTKKKWLLPGRVLMHKFRGKLRAMLLEELDAGRLRVPPAMTEAQVRSDLNRLGRATLNVRIQPQYQHGLGVVKYLARYLKGGPISPKRLLGFRNDMVRFAYRDRRGRDNEMGDDGKGVRCIETLPAQQFIGRYLQHVPLPRFQTVRRYGLYASTSKAQLNHARAHWGQAEYQPPERATWWELIDDCMPQSQRDPGCCPECGERLVCERLGRQYQRGPPHFGPPLSLTAVDTATGKELTHAI